MNKTVTGETATKTITKIERQRHNEKRFSIFLDDTFAFGMSGTDLLYHKLSEGQKLSEQELEFLYKNILFGKARDKAIKFLAYRARSQKEVEEKLRESDIPTEVIEDVVKFLMNYGYIDDYKFTQMYISDKTKLKGYGKARLLAELREKGVSTEIIDEAIDGAEIDEVSLALKHLRKRAKGEINLDEKQKQRIAGYLQRRGFSHSIIRAAFASYEDEQ